jgi:hypothetical protein
MISVDSGGFASEAAEGAAPCGLSAKREGAEQSAIKPRNKKHRFASTERRVGRDEGMNM